MTVSIPKACGIVSNVASDHSTVTHLFVYGTLRPGDVRWHFLSPFVVDDGWPDTVRGAVYDTGLEYPAARFGGPEVAETDTVHGHTFALLESTLDRCLDVLDEEEDTVGGMYRRVPVTTGRGTRAWAYEYGTGLTLTRIASGDWFTR